MSTERFKSALEQIVGRAQQVRGRGEQATRQAMILPFLEALGFDIWNTEEVAPEYVADTAIKKFGQKEKVDFALLIEGVPRAFIEVKPLGEPLDGHQGQLARYFNATPTVSLAIITDGIEYRFYTDTVEPNIQDAQPFFVARLDAPEVPLEVLLRFHKARFDSSGMRTFATDLTYTAQFESFLRNQLDIRNREPSDELTRWILGQSEVWSGRTTAAVVDRFRPVLKAALTRVLRDVVRRSLAMLDESISGAESSEQLTQTSQLGSVADAEHAQPATGSAVSAIVTTERELTCYRIVESMFQEFPHTSRRYFDASKRQIVDAQLGFKDTTGYFAIYVNKVSDWFVRIQIEQRYPNVGFDLEPEVVRGLLPAGFELMPSSAFARCRVGIGRPEDIVALKEIVHAAIRAKLDEG